MKHRALFTFASMLVTAANSLIHGTFNGSGEGQESVEDIVVLDIEPGRPRPEEENDGLTLPFASEEWQALVSERDAMRLPASDAPSLMPSDAPSLVPSDAPSLISSEAPSLVPSDAPSLVTSDSPSQEVEVDPLRRGVARPPPRPIDPAIIASSAVPSLTPSDVPSLAPSDVPSLFPSDAPSLAPSDAPSIFPSYDALGELSSSTPSMIPSDAPSILSSTVPSQVSSDTPSSTPTIVDRVIGTDGLTSDYPSYVPSIFPSLVPSDVPSLSPSFTPSGAFGESGLTDIPLGSDYPSLAPDRSYVIVDTDPSADAGYPIDYTISCSDVNADYTEAFQLDVQYVYELGVDPVGVEEAGGLDKLAEDIEKLLRTATLEGLCDTDEEPLSVSALPYDSSSGSCGGYCFIMEGHTTLEVHPDETANSLAITCAALDSIGAFIEKGGLDHLKGIAWAKYVEPETDMCEEVAGVETESSEAQSVDDVSTYPVVAIAAFAFGSILIGTMAIAWKRRSIASARSTEQDSMNETSCTSPRDPDGKVHPIHGIHTFSSSPESLQTASLDVDPVATMGFCDISLDDDSPIGTNLTDLTV